MSWSPKPALLRVYRAMRQMLVPGLRSSQTLYEGQLCHVVTAQTRWLDVGCGHQVLPDGRTDIERALVGRAARVIGVDPDRQAIAKHLTISDIRVGSVEVLPFPTNSFELVTANMVLEHIAHPLKAFTEVRRVLVPGGVFLFHTPNAKSYIVAGARLFPDFIKRYAARVLHGREASDVYPAYYRCNSKRAISEVASACGLEVVSSQHVSTNAVFVIVPPIAILELLWIRATRNERFAGHRANIITILRKPEMN